MSRSRRGFRRFASGVLAAFVAGAVGTSHRMLLHHFGSREDLLLAVVEEVERRQMGLLSTLPTDPAEGFAGLYAENRSHISIGR